MIKQLHEVKQAIWHAANELLVMQMAKDVNREMMKARIEEIFREIGKL